MINKPFGSINVFMSCTTTLLFSTMALAGEIGMRLDEPIHVVTAVFVIIE